MAASKAGKRAWLRNQAPWVQRRRIPSHTVIMNDFSRISEADNDVFLYALMTPFGATAIEEVENRDISL